MNRVIELTPRTHTAALTAPVGFHGRHPGRAYRPRGCRQSESEMIS